ncbi:hypothetical protein HYFRA_00009850 [Hymenoscyphus fraxineus]|uniref:GH16 domain-containing protein n=1 Tax=Hymenoscyphus fraxineus TaxID=746836 RepID=A0A9N9PWQ0_9HELO|nr:hypothetical protein HYFRA_00009850 [Hymenoscyphus fraxineus]
MVSLTFLTIFGFLSAFCPLASSYYTLKFQYDSSNWFQKFEYRNGNDPTHGTVDYVDLYTAQSLGLTKIVDGRVYMGVDMQSVVPDNARGRKSIWAASRDEFTHGLVIGDFQHMPENVCGIWPAFWTVRDEASPYGEIDIVEYFNDDASNGAITTYTDPKLPQCTFNQSPNGQTQPLSENFRSCTGDGGCSTVGPAAGYGAEFNKNDGGVWAMDWTSTAIRVWFFPRGTSGIPSDITNGNPNPALWPLPLAHFQRTDGGCDIDKHYLAQSIWFDTTFCGDNAGGEGWTSWTDCGRKTGVTCDEWVRKHPETFQNAYWLVNSVKVYQQ